MGSTSTAVPSIHFWKIAPGENAAFWPECRDGGFICVGWEKLGDMREYTDEAAFKELYREACGSPRIRQWHEIWSFAKEIKEGDIIIANNGLSEIVGVGTCAGEYYYDNARQEYKHCLPVRWDVFSAFAVPDAARPISASWFQGTIKELSREEYNQIAAGASSKPVWRRSGQFGLQLTNTPVFDAPRARQLFNVLLTAPSPTQEAINQHIREDLGDWLNHPRQVLVAEAYVTLSNWFLSSRIYSDTERGRIAGELWDVLFAVRPERLSDKARNTKIIPDAFEAWWTRMKAAGAAFDGAAPNPPLAYNSTETVAPSGRYAAICNATFLPEAFFQNCERLLESKKQIILQGAPGTGKTFVAEKLAELWAGDRSRVKIVQFHESFGYEDFIHGIKPERDPVTGKTAFVPKDGLFLRLCEQVRSDASGSKYVLLIDEINRAKTARVFGELLYLLEYRDRDVELQHGQPFSIPPNLYIMGTMNTTDKSIALVDYALRRRFAFIDLVPVRDGQSTVLRKWLDANGIRNAPEIERLFVTLNEAIATKDEALMVGHSYFMVKQAAAEKHFSPELLAFIWEYYILPLIAEYEYQLSRTELEEKYSLNALRSVMTT
jgi:5-methylcytosine-specific restriction protein B